MMLSSISLATVFIASLMASTSYAYQGAQDPTYQGCYSSSQGLVQNDTNIYQSRGHCGDQCDAQGKVVMAMTGGDQCWCGDAMPPLSSKVGDGNCSAICVGWKQDNCGSPSGLTPIYFAVWNAGLVQTVTNAPARAATGSPSSSTSGGGAAAVTTVTGGQTVVVTAPSSPSPGTSSSGPSTAGIAAGVVVGIIVISAIAGGAWFYLRAKHRREVEEEYKRQAAVSAFINGGKPGSSAGSSHDTRLDPVIMTQRRMSDGSIADNQDYSRRILKVTNA